MVPTAAMGRARLAQLAARRTRARPSTHANNVLLGTDTNNIIRRLAFFSGRSVAGKGTQDEFVYVAGGGQLFKHKEDGEGCVRPVAVGHSGADGG